MTSDQALTNDTGPSGFRLQSQCRHASQWPPLKQHAVWAAKRTKLEPGVGSLQ